MLISEFARAAGLSADTVRFYIRKGLLSPETGGKGGSNPYQIFDAQDVETARIIRLTQSLGFSLKEIAALNDEYRAGAMTPGRAASIMRSQLARLEEKAAQLSGMIAYIGAKVAWLEGGGEGPEPTFMALGCGQAARALSAAPAAGRTAATRRRR